MKKLALIITVIMSALLLIYSVISKNIYVGISALVLALITKKLWDPELFRTYSEKIIKQKSERQVNDGK